MERHVNEKGEIITPNGYKQNMLDFIATKPFIKRSYDYTTKNISFLNMHVLFKKLGLKNHNEHLQIFDTDLIGVDPFSKILTNEIKAKIDNEIRINPWYYLREVVRIPYGDEVFPFNLDLLSYTTTFFMMRCQELLTEAPRQTGKTLSSTAFISWIINFGGRGHKLANLHYKAEECIKNLNGIESILNALPDYLQYHKKVIGKEDKKGNIQIKDKARSAAKKEYLVCEMFNNKIESVVVGTTEEQASNAGRGRTMNIWLVDEIAFIKHNHLAYGSFKPAFSRASEMMKEQGQLFGIWALTTPGNLKLTQGKWIYDKVMNEYLLFSSKHFAMFDMCIEELEEYLAKRSRAQAIFISYDKGYLGYNNDWFTRVSRGLSIDTIRSDILLKWEVKTGNSPFNPSVITALENRSNMVKDTMKTLTIVSSNDQINEIQIFPNEGDMTSDLGTFLFKYSDGIIIGADTAYGVGGDGDSSTLVGVDAKTLRVLFTYSSNTISIDEFAILIIDILDKYIIPYGYNVAISPERNASGRTLISTLRKYKDYSKYFVVFPIQSERRLKDPTAVVDYTFNYKGINTKFDIGLNVDSDIRESLVNLLIKLATKHTEAIAVPPIVDELKTLVVKITAGGGKQRIEHAEGKHDDLIFGLLHAIYPAIHNAELLYRRNNILIEPTKFLINDNSKSINVTGNLSKRITVSYKTENNRIVTTYYDNIQKRFVDAEVAKKLSEEDKYDMITSVKKEPTILEETKENLVVHDIIKSRYGEETYIKNKEVEKNIVDSINDTVDNWYAEMFSN